MLATVDNDLMALLERDEGIRLKAYDDATGSPIGPGSLLKGHPTIGTGRSLDERGIRDDERLLMLRNDLTQAILDCEAVFGEAWLAIDIVRHRTFINLALNLGRAGLAAFRVMVGAAIAGNWELAAAELLRSDAAGKEPARFHRLSETLRTGTQV